LQDEVGETELGGLEDEGGVLPIPTSNEPEELGGFEADDQYPRENSQFVAPQEAATPIRQAISQQAGLGMVRITLFV
jgi:hypothetical protein